MGRMSKLATASTTTKSSATVRLTTTSTRTTVGVSFTLLMGNGDSRRRNPLQTLSMSSIRMPRSRRLANGETKMESVIVRSRSLHFILSCNIPLMSLSSDVFRIHHKHTWQLLLFPFFLRGGIAEEFETLNADLGITSMNGQERPAKLVYV